MSRVDLFCETCSLATKTVAPTLPGFKGIKRCVLYMAIHPHKPIFYPYDYNYGLNVTRITWSENKVEYHTTHNFLECRQYSDHDRILNRRRSFSGIINTLLGFSVCWKVKIQPDIASESTDVEIRCMYKDVKTLSGDTWNI